MSGVTGVRVALSAAIYAIDRPYDYLVPPELLNIAQVGMRVMVPFGAGNRRAEGFILDLVEVDLSNKKLKSILLVLDEKPVLNSNQIQLALWMRDRYFCTLYDAARSMLPAGLWFALRDSYTVVETVTRDQSYQLAGRSSSATKVLDIIWANEGRATVEQIKLAFSGKDPNPGLKVLTDCGAIRLETDATRNIGDKTEQIVTLLLPPEEAMALVTPKKKTAPLRYAVVELLCSMESGSSKEICYFTGASSQTLKSLAKSEIVSLEKREVLRRVKVNTTKSANPPILNQEQQVAFTQLNQLAEDDKPAVSLLYGVTGSGKTQVYIALIRAALERGETAMVLVPEIALTPQLLHIFTAQFGDLIAVLHSALRVGERYDEWKRVRAGDAKVVLGTRSAVFAPLDRLGIIILDEEQETSYKSETTPRYHARDVAKYRCAKEKSLLVLGSATPSIETMYAAKTGSYHMVTLTQRFNQHAMPSVLISDTKDELRQGNNTSISELLHRELATNIERGEQSILFLNRRGSNRMVSCFECGEVPMCERCSVYLTYHGVNGRLMCHYCGHSEKVADTCSACGGSYNFIGAGTQKVEEELRVLFPDTDMLRMDADTITATRTHETILSEFEAKQVPILIGTQMVAKGLDFENVTLVGVISADLMLYVDHFRASERTFSLLTQVVGRAGRGEKSGRAVIQTYTPDNEVIRFAASQDYDQFYDQEIGMRKLTQCPPFHDIFMITISGLNESAVVRTCMKLRGALDHWLKTPEMQELSSLLVGPAPAPVAKVNNRYRYRLTLRSRNNNQVRKWLAHLLRTASSDKENKGVSLFIDVNPFD